MFDYKWFKTEVFKLSGIDLSCYKEKQMKRRIDALIKKCEIEQYDKYIKAIKENVNMYNEFINYLTINVSEFYRNPEQWEVLQKDVYPSLLSTNKKIKIWSAACSSGDEPYTLVMTLNKFLPLNEIKILATDIDKEILKKAEKGVYSPKSLVGLPQDYIDNFFDKNEGFYQVKDTVKKCVEFKQHNLLRDKYPTDLDLIVCRNVLIYFTDEAKNNIYTWFNQALRPSGILFVGSTEQIIMANQYNFKALKTFFYVKESK